MYLLQKQPKRDHQGIAVPISSHEIFRTMNRYWGILIKPEGQKNSSVLAMNNCDQDIRQKLEFEIHIQSGTSTATSSLIPKKKKKHL